MTVAYTAAILVSALLLFLIQPMITKHLVPTLGGAPGVWNTAMCFFQAVLLLGYLFAHLTHRLFSKKVQSLAHFALLGASLLWLPLSIVLTEVDVLANPSGWLVATLAFSVGLPFLALSSNSPTLQAWFANTDHPDRENPYFLYSASNLGSMVALLAYPVLIEPYLDLAEQRLSWSLLYGVLVVLLVVCAVLMWPAPAEVLGLRRRAMWVLLAFVPSSLLLGTTTYVTTDLAAVPLLWTFPLALYLLSSVFVFARKPILHPDLVGALIPLSVALTALLFFDWFRSGAAFIALPFLVLFVASMACHGRLADDRPSPAYLTEFYLWLSVGGVCGGIFNAILAPMLFDLVWEYPLALTLAIMLLPKAEGADRSRRATVLDIALPAAVGVGLALYSASISAWPNEYIGALSTLGSWFGSLIPPLGELAVTPTGVLTAVLYTSPVVACFFFRKRPVRFALMLGGIFYIAFAQPFQTQSDLVFRGRSFFGSIRVVELRNSQVRHMYDGAALHGLQRATGKGRLRATSYYAPLRQLWSSMPEPFREGEIGVAGLGAGTIACLAGPRQHVTFYEINPMMERVAKDPELFTYLRDCPPQSEVVLGDARLLLAREPDARFDLLILDAFSSHAVPVHLITLEAVDLYLAKIRPDGVLAFNISSQHLDLVPVLAALAAARDLHGVWRMDLPDRGDPLERPSRWAILSRESGTIDRLKERDDRWEALPEASEEKLFTDSFSNILSVLN